MSRIEAVIRSLIREDIPEIAGAFGELGWNRPVSQYERYLLQQQEGLRDVLVAFVEERFAGYLTICRESSYQPFFIHGIPEIVDFNVLPGLRHRGIGTQLMDRAEGIIAGFSSVAGIGVGMTSDYGAAQKLYARRGYVPDGRGMHWRDHHVQYREEIVVDDNLALYLIKDLV